MYLAPSHSLQDMVDVFKPLNEWLGTATVDVWPAPYCIIVYTIYNLKIDFKVKKIALIYLKEQTKH